MENREEKTIETNRAELAGVILSEPYFSHKTYGESFYELAVGVERKSGCLDCVRVTVSERLLKGQCNLAGLYVSVLGQVRTYNEEVCGRSKLNIVVFAKEFVVCEEPVKCCNVIYLEGFICKPPIRRTSPLGREICDIMLAVNRMYNKSDYIPCIAWGRNAAYAGGLGVGARLCIEGRLQSREYKKRDVQGNCTTHTAYEVSILKIDE